ncbi:hypothetical protein ACFVAJ_17430 [Agromyces sp. NPDC057679]|uniref:hypothetical protein n=1 Tax=Agromyces sp. NPDC057679 TaxID=3346207 RepID=UPI00366BC1BE
MTEKSLAPNLDRNGWKTVVDTRAGKVEGYLIQARGTEYRWIWTEPNEELDTDGYLHDSVHAALRDAARNWEDAGSGGRYSADLRRRATIAEKKLAPGPAPVTDPYYGYPEAFVEKFAAARWDKESADLGYPWAEVSNGQVREDCRLDAAIELRGAGATWEEELRVHWRYGPKSGTETGRTVAAIYEQLVKKLDTPVTIDKVERRYVLKVTTDWEDRKRDQ